MELRHLRSLVAIADSGGFTRAAATLHIAQPALSQHIARLEAETALTLVDRTRGQVRLTDAGEALARRARRALAEVDAAAADLAAFRGLRAGRLTLGVTPTPGPVDLAALLAGFNARYGGIELRVRDGLTATLLDDLRRDRLDAAIVTGEPPPDMGYTELAAEPLVAVVVPSDPLARRRRIDVGALLERRLVGFPPPATIRVALEAEAARRGTALAVAFEVEDVARVRDLVAAGLGAAVLPASDADRPGPPVHALTITGADLRHRVSLVWRGSRPQPPAVDALIELAGEEPQPVPMSVGAFDSGHGDLARHADAVPG